MAHMTTETQDVRMPVQYECRTARLDRADEEERELPRIKCVKCHQEFSTQGRTDADKALPRGPLVSERFEVARTSATNCGTLAVLLINLKGYTGPIAIRTDDRGPWMLSRWHRDPAVTSLELSLSTRRRCTTSLGRVLQFLRRDAEEPAAGGANAGSQRILAHAWTLAALWTR